MAIRTIVFNAGPSVIEARFAGQIDLATIGPSPALNGCVQSQGAARPIVAGAASAGTAFVVRPAAESAGGCAGRSSNFLAELKRNPLT